MPRSPPVCAVQIYLADPARQDEGDLALAWSVLDDEERAHADRLVQAIDRQTYVVAHGLLRGALARHAGVAAARVRFWRTPHGRPELVPPTGDAGPAVRFNLAHTRGLVGCALTATADVGFDLEQVLRPAPLDVAPQHFSDQERTGLDALPARERDDRFYTLWTLKEAYIKARGLGLAIPLDWFSVAPIPRGEARLTTGDPGQGDTRWTLRWWRLPGHAMALAVHAPFQELGVTLLADIRLGALRDSDDGH